MAARKSIADRQFARETKGLLQEYQSAKIDFAEFSHRTIAAVNRSVPKMTEDELMETQCLLFETMNNVADVLAKSGHPACGNDPKRPN